MHLLTVVKSLDSVIGKLEKYRVDRQRNLVSASEYLIKEYIWKHFSCYYM